MREHRNGTRLIDKSLDRLSVPRDLLLEHLYGDRALHYGIDRLENHRHSADADYPYYSVPTVEYLTDVFIVLIHWLFPFPVRRPALRILSAAR